MATENTPQARRGLPIKTPADYLQRLGGIRQVGGSQAMEHTLGSASVLARRIAYPMIKANLNLGASGAPNAYKHVMGAGRDKLITAALRFSEWADSAADKCLGRHMKALDELDHGLLKSIARRGYLSGVPNVNNHVVQNVATSVLGSMDGIGSIAMTNRYNGDTAAFDSPKTRSPLGSSGWIRALILCHEAAHVEFRRIKEPFNPTPGRISPGEEERENGIVKAINAWGVHEINAQENAPKLTRAVLNENHSDALAALIILKESGLDPEAVKAVEQLARERERMRMHHASSGTMEEHDGGGLSLRRVLQMKEELPSMTAMEIKTAATRIASDSLFDLIDSSDPSFSKLLLLGLCPQNSIDTGRLVVDMADKRPEEVSDVVTEHPSYSLLNFDVAWLKDRHGDLAGSKTRMIHAWGRDHSQVRSEHAAFQVLARNRPLTMHRGDIEHSVNTAAPSGMSQDVFVGRLALAREFAQDWDRARSLVTKVTEEYMVRLGAPKEETPSLGIEQQQPRSFVRG